MAKVHLELNLARGMKDRKKGFYRYCSSKRKSRENGSLLLNSIGKLVMTDVEEAKILNAVFAFVFIG